MIVLSVEGVRKHFGPEPVLDGVTFDVRPGVYVLTAAGTAHPAWTPETVVGGRALGAFVAPRSSEAPTAVVHTPPAELSAGQRFTVRADVVSRAPVDSVALFVRKVGEWRRTLRLSMEPARAPHHMITHPVRKAKHLQTESFPQTFTRPIESY